MTSRQRKSHIFSRADYRSAWKKTRSEVTKIATTSAVVLGMNILAALHNVNWNDDCYSPIIGYCVAAIGFGIAAAIYAQKPKPPKSYKRALALSMG